MIRATDVHSVSDFTRSTKAFIEKLKETKNPMVLTVNGNAEVVVQDAESYQSLVDELERTRFKQAVEYGLKDIESGDHTPARLFAAEMKAKYEV